MPLTPGSVVNYLESWKMLLNRVYNVLKCNAAKSKKLFIKLFNKKLTYFGNRKGLKSIDNCNIALNASSVRRKHKLKN